MSRRAGPRASRLCCAPHLAQAGSGLASGVGPATGVSCACHQVGSGDDGHRPRLGRPRMRMRSSYVNGSSGDNVNSTTHGAWKYFIFTK
ncbi:hypothetical protein [Streptomyces atratus]|uniref:hypothetical protein n=1 Tax=Streptomyces atratus TaxID=1893 RepID=UPI003661709A